MTTFQLLMVAGAAIVIALLIVIMVLHILRLQQARNHHTDQTLENRQEAHKDGEIAQLATAVRELRELLSLNGIDYYRASQPRLGSVQKPRELTPVAPEPPLQSGEPAGLYGDPDGEHSGGQPLIVEGGHVPAFVPPSGYVSGYLPAEDVLAEPETDLGHEAHPAPDYSTGPVDPTAGTGETVDDSTVVTTETELDQFWAESPAQPQPDELTVPPRFITTGELIKRVNATGVQAIADSLASNSSGEPAAAVPTTAAKLAGLQRVSASAAAGNVYDTGEQRWVNEGGPDGELQPAVTEVAVDEPKAQEVDEPLMANSIFAEVTGRFDIAALLADQTQQA